MKLAIICGQLITVSNEDINSLKNTSSFNIKDSHKVKDEEENLKESGEDEITEHVSADSGSTFELGPKTGFLLSLQNEITHQ